MTLDVNARSSKSKGNTDGDNLKLVINGNVLQNPHALTSDKYKNFYFSGDLKESDSLTLAHEDFSEPLAFENSLELWYDESPEIINLTIEIFHNKDFFKNLKRLLPVKTYIRTLVRVLIFHFQSNKMTYSAEFLEHALKTNPGALIFDSDHPLVKKIKVDPTYKNILKKLKEKVWRGILEGEIWPEDFKDNQEMKGEINFNSEDLSTSLHGIHKIEYKGTHKNKKTLLLKIRLFDIYDFQQQKIPFSFSGIKKYLKALTVNVFDAAENLSIIHNFEIEIYLQETLHGNY